MGAVLRVAVLPLTNDYDVLKGWSYVAATRGEPRLYDWAAAPDDLRLRMVDGFDARADYPPLALYELGLAGRVYYWASGQRFPRSDALTAAVKAPALVAEAALGVLLFAAVRSTASVQAARWAALVFWLNPAMILATGVLGYVDTLFVLPAIAALVAGVRGHMGVAGGLMAAALLTKPQAVFLAPALGLAVWRGGATGGARTRALAGGAVLVSLIVLLPIVAAGASTNMIRAVGNLALGKDMLSYACNLWWIVGHALRALQTPGMDVAAALTMPAEGLQMSAVTDFTSITARVVVRSLGSVLAVAVAAWGVWVARQSRDLWLFAAVGAFCTQAFFVLATQVHENHQFAVIPLLGLAAAGRRRFGPLLVTMSTLFTMNLMLFSGAEHLRNVFPPSPVDWTLIVAAANCAALIWFGVILRRESAPDASRP